MVIDKGISMSGLKKGALGFLSIYPIAYMFVAGGFITYTIVRTRQGSEIERTFESIFESGLFFLVFPLHFLAIFGAIGLVMYYIYRVIKIDELEGRDMILWCVFLFMFSFLTLPAYWYLYIWRDDDGDGRS